MKKFILLAAVASTFITCKKGESAASSEESSPVVSADSAFSANIQTVQDATEKVLDSAEIRIKDFDKAKSEAAQKMEATVKSVDSLSQKISSIKLESKTGKVDSAEKNKEKIVVNVPAPKVIKETKIVYKEAIKPKEKTVENPLLKSGILEINVENAENAKEMVMAEVEKYDGSVKNENISVMSNSAKMAYLKVKVPVQKFDYLMEDLSENIGEVQNKGIDVRGEQLVAGTLCDLEITLYGNSVKAVNNDKPDTFGGKSLAAVNSGWNVVTSVFLFILPLWPLFVVAGIVYYFYKKKKNNDGENQVM